MLATQHVPDPAMRDLEQELARTMARAYDSNRQAREGFFHLTRRMDNDEDDQFDVDHTILDFLAYKATATVFEWQACENRWERDLPNALVTMTAEWRFFMSNVHQGRRLSSLATFRSRLLQFSLLFTHRYHPSQTWTNKESLQRLRDVNDSRRQLWQNAHSPDEPACTKSPLSDNELESVRRRRTTALGLPSSFRLDMCSERGRPSLHELLPLFVELTAARANLGDDWQPTSDWFELAGQFMLQAVIDRHLVDRECQPAAIISIFAFGSVGAEREDGEGTDITAMRRLFCRENQPTEELPEWTAIRRRYIREVAAIRTFEKIEDDHSYIEFQENLLSFLQHLHDSTVKPDLVQVEEGRINIDGNELSEKESRDMIRRMRL
ncbi:uncharacterized protein EKO05_0009706 [Ascochyta rabiei]|uniref:Uncharacterized protein n=1 Tax=Didymella rabiei TaxID=5454 RepID=A0A163CMB8_DIDRA|nr:uncharacterized protein EKO05_0009706 [Ascochyta rabiei]KZM22563.1 hypothetical protein ST47_g6182 [Ascochyta rabiei]UPX19445.1 hypothetical protein EKO05_0009706 [Ascochyta rabiei]